MNVNKTEQWRTEAEEEYNRAVFWSRVIASFITYHQGNNEILGIGIRRLSKIMSFSVERPMFRKSMLLEITYWAKLFMWKLHVEISNDFADLYHLDRIESLAKDKIETEAELDKANEEKKNDQD